MVGKDNMEILSEISTRIEHSKVKLKRWSQIQELLDERIEILGSTIFGNLGSKEFVPMLVRQSTKCTMNRLDEIYPKVAPKSGKKKKAAIIKLYPSLLEE